MENPCKNCLVKPMCYQACNELDKFAKLVLKKPYNSPVIKYWITNYEIRPRVIEVYHQYNKMVKSCHK
ncbi:MAG: hypothetical protein ACTSWK_02020 [Promethearchaeota archaeon]